MEIGAHGPTPWNPQVLPAAPPARVPQTLATTASSATPARADPPTLAMLSNPPQSPPSKAAADEPDQPAHLRPDQS